MNPLVVFPTVTDQQHLNFCCAELILAAESECGAFIIAATQLVGEEIALCAGHLWVEALETNLNFRCRRLDLRCVTIHAAGLLADTIGAK